VWVEKRYIVDKDISPKGSRANLSVPKKVIGSMNDGAVKLSPAAPTLGLAEGFEDALAVSQLYRLPCWASIGSARMAKVAIPDNVQHLIVFADADVAGIRAARQVEDAHKSTRCVSVMFPERGAKDFCEMLSCQ